MLLTGKMLGTQLFKAAYKLINIFRPVAATIRAIETTNHTVLAAFIPRHHDPIGGECARSPFELVSNVALSAIACGDGDPRTYDADAYRVFFNKPTHEAPNMGPIWATFHRGCTQ